MITMLPKVCWLNIGAVKFLFHRVPYFLIGSGSGTQHFFFDHGTSWVDTCFVTWCVILLGTSIRRWVRMGCNYIVNIVHCLIGMEGQKVFPILLFLQCSCYWWWILPIPSTDRAVVCCLSCTETWTTPRLLLLLLGNQWNIFRCCLEGKKR